MSVICKLPSAKNNKGEIIPSKLFRSLVGITQDRYKAMQLYGYAKSRTFQKIYKETLVYEDSDEPTLDSLMSIDFFKEKVDTKDVENKVFKEEGIQKEVPYTQDNYNKAIDKAIKYNTKDSEFGMDYVATVARRINEEGKSVVVTELNPSNLANIALSKQMEYNKELNEMLYRILANHGVSVGTLTDLEEKLMLNGVTDFSVAKETAEGMIEFIRLARGEQGERALPEEFAHWALEALDDSPLVGRLVNNLIQNGLVQEILGEDYERYSSLYNRDSYRLAKEAAGKLLAEHLIKSKPVSPAAPHKGLLSRIIEMIKNFFKGLEISSIRKAMDQADSEFGELAKNILEGDLDVQLDNNNINVSEKYFSIEQTINKDKALLEKIINNEKKTIEVFKQKNKTFDENHNDFLNTLETKLIQDREIEAIYNYLDHAVAELKKVDDKMAKIAKNEGTSVFEKARTLRDAQNYIESYDGIIKEIRKFLNEDANSDNRFEAKAREAVNQASVLIEQFKCEFLRQGMPTYLSFLEPFVGKEIKVAWGKYAGKIITIENLLIGGDGGLDINDPNRDAVIWANKEIGLWDRYMDSASSSNDYMVKINDKIVKIAKGEARLDTIEIAQQLKAAGIELEQAGITDFKWMFETFPDGSLTGNYIQEIDYGKYKKDKAEFLKYLDTKYGKNPQGKNQSDRTQEYKEWYNKTHEDVPNGTGKRVRKSLYENKNYTQLSGAKKKFYDTVIKIKEQMDSYLPTEFMGIRTHSAPKILKDLIERVKDSKDIKDGSRKIWESIKDDYIRRVDDTDFGYSAAVTDFNDREVQVLPVYYTKMKDGHSMNDMSTDVVSTMCAYAAMANDFRQMNKIIDCLELGRTILEERKSSIYRNNSPVMSVLGKGADRVKNLVTKPADVTYWKARLDDFFSMQVYGRYMADEGSFGKTGVDKAKFFNKLNKDTALLTYACNGLAAITNVLTGKAMHRIESIAGQFWNESNTLHADRIYAQELPAFLAEIGNRVKTSKFALWSEYFDVMHDYDNAFTDLDFDQRNWFTRMFGSNMLFVLSNAGEHWMQHRTSLALADKYKVKDKNGKEISLWDAFEVQYLDESNQDKGAKLVLKEGVTKLDGSAFTKQDALAFSRRTSAINQKLHGTYNKADRNAFQQLGIGRVAMMYRKFIPEAINRRWQELHYNFDTEEWEEGYYRTSAKFVYNLFQDIRNAKFDIAARWNSLRPTEKANIKKALAEVAHLLFYLGLFTFVKWPDRYWGNLYKASIRREITELGLLTPSLMMPKEMLNTLKSPAAGINTLERWMDTLGLANPMNYETFGGKDAIVKSGRFKDCTKAERLFWRSPFVPLGNTVYRTLNPETTLSFYK